MFALKECISHKIKVTVYLSAKSLSTQNKLSVFSAARMGSISLEINVLLAVLRAIRNLRCSVNLARIINMSALIRQSVFQTARPIWLVWLETAVLKVAKRPLILMRKRKDVRINALIIWILKGLSALHHVLKDKLLLLKVWKFVHPVNKAKLSRQMVKNVWLHALHSNILTFLVTAVC